MGQNKPKKILIITNQPFPAGFAGTNRILSYCKGFLYHGYKPEVICIRPTEHYETGLNKQVLGVYEGIQYSYPGETTLRVRSFWGRRINDLTAYLISMKTLFFLLQKNEILFVIFYGTYVFPELSCIFLTRLFGKKIFKEESENPHVYFTGRKSAFMKIFEWFYINRLYKLCSGIFVMTNHLKDFFLERGIPENKILIIPHTVDVERFTRETNNSMMSLPDDYIAYLGPINQQKDGILTLVESFKEVSAKYPEMNLIIAGAGSPQEKIELLSLINELHLNARVHYLGRISSDEIPTLFRGATLLASCRTKSFQNKYSFPSKVVEYLASGKPVVTTAPGDLSYYLKDKVNAFVANNENPDTIASKILEVLQDYDFAIKVGQNGKMLVNDKFNPITQTKKIINFCK